MTLSLNLQIISSLRLTISRILTCWPKWQRQDLIQLIIDGMSSLISQQKKLMGSRYLTSQHLILLNSQSCPFTLKGRQQKRLNYQSHRNTEETFQTMISTPSLIMEWLSSASSPQKKRLRSSLSRCKNNIIKSLSLHSLKNKSSLNQSMMMNLCLSMILRVNSIQR